MRALSMFLVAFALVGCAKPWNGAHSALQAFAVATVQTDAVLAEVQTPQLNDVKARVLDRYGAELREFAACRESADPTTCEDPGTPEAFTAEHYDTDPTVIAWNKVSTGVNETKRQILAGESAVVAWRKMREAPENWPFICRAIQAAADSVTDSLIAVDVDVPPAWDEGRRFISPLCMFAGNAITSSDKRKDVVL